ncbi:MAG: recombinase family protein [Clostridia bacterium]|nr:recombinase family protein [Clostridia bacterium]
MEQYALYLRKSRADLDAEARGEGETLAKHRAALTEYAKRRGLFIAQEYAEIVSGDSIAARPQMQQLLADVKAGLYSGVIVNDVDRLGRGDSIDQEIIKITFAAAHTLIITPTRDIDPANPSDEDMLDFSMFFARFEYRKISQRLSVGRARSAAAGNYIVSHIPYGYMRVMRDGRPTLAPHPDQAPIVKLIYDLYASGAAGYMAIASRLTDMGIRTNSGRLFSPSAVRVILRSPVYVGQVTYGRTRQASVMIDGARKKIAVPSDSMTVVEDAHPAIIPRELFVRAQDRLHAAAPVNRARALSNPLAGLIRCAACGHTMTVHARGSGTRKYLGCDTRSCPTLASPIEAVENALLEALRGYAATYAEPDAEPDDSAAQIAALTRQLETVEARLSRARELVETGIYTPREYLTQRDTLTAQSDSIRAQIAALNRPKPVPVAPAVISSTLDAYPLAETTAQKNELLKSILDHADYKKTERSRPGGPQTFALDLYPKLGQHID